MAQIKDNGLVLREEVTGESNKRLVLLTENMGKTYAFARGAKGIKSKLAVEKLSYCEFVFFDGGQFLSLTSVTPIHHFHKIPSCYDAYLSANVILELADTMILPQMQARDPLRLILHALTRLNAGKNPKLTLAAFIFKFLQQEGFTPTTTAGTRFGHEGLTHDPKAPLSLNPATIAALNYIIQAQLKATFGFKTSQDVAEELLQAAKIFLRANVDANLKSLDFMM
ncbi:MAG: DNA repair protein RecO [Defluviitaleaceae bacterium]|nr:DNA repair protein RecO [Defluviitaleaceae bacterium]